MHTRLLIVGLLLLAGGCFRSTRVSFPPPQKVTEIRIRDLSGPEDGPEIKIDNPERIHDILAYLNERSGKWEKYPYTPAAGRYSVSFVGQDIKLFLRTGNGTMEVQGGDYTPFFRDLNDTEQRTLLALLTIRPTPESAETEIPERIAAPEPRGRSREARPGL